jgi:ankyrin repeat protein
MPRYGTEEPDDEEIQDRRAAFIAMLYKTLATISDSIQRTPDGGNVQSAAIQSLVSILKYLSLQESQESEAARKQAVLDKALINCIRFGRPKGARKLLQAGADVSALCDSDRDVTKTALYLAVEKGNAELVRLLVDSGAGVSGTLCRLGRQRQPGGMVVRQSKTALYLAVEKAIEPGNTAGNTAGNTYIVRVLADAGADVSTECTLGEDVTKTALYLAVEQENVELVRILVDAGADVSTECNLGRQSREGLHLKTALYLAVEQGNAELVRILVSRGANVNTLCCLGAEHILQERQLAKTALYLALEKRNADVVRILVDAGANINIRSQLQYDAQETALGLAISRGDPGLVRALNPTPRDINPRLSAAIESNDADLVRLLLDAAVDLTLPDDLRILDRTIKAEILLWAAAKGDNEIITRILPTGPCSFSEPSECEDDGWEVLKLRDSVLEAANKARPRSGFFGRPRYPDTTDFFDKKNSNGMTALMLAAEQANMSGVHALISGGADINITNGEGHNALMLALQPPYFEATEENSVVWRLLNQDEDITAVEISEARRSDNMTAWLLAAQYGNQAAMCLLKDKLSMDQMNQTDNKGNNALMLAAAAGHTSVVQFLRNPAAQAYGDAPPMALPSAPPSALPSAPPMALPGGEAGKEGARASTVGVSPSVMTAASVEPQGFASKFDTVKGLRITQDGPAPDASALITLNQTNTERKTALMLAAEAGKKEVVGELIGFAQDHMHRSKIKAWLELRDTGGDTALILAAKHADQETREELAKFYTTYSARTTDLYATQYSDIEPEAPTAAGGGAAAAASEDPAVVKAAGGGAAAAAAPIGLALPGGLGGLHDPPMALPVESGGAAAAKPDMSSSGAPVQVAQPDTLGASAAADPTMQTQPTVACRQAFSLAAENGQAAVVTELIGKVDIEDRKVALLLAAKNGHAAVVTELIRPSQGQNIDTPTKNDALLSAAKNGHAAVVAKLIGGVGTDAQKAALLSAAENGHAAVVAKLIGEVGTDDRKAALLSAAENGHAAVVAKLIASNTLAEEVNNALSLAQEALAQANQECAAWESSTPRQDLHNLIKAFTLEQTLPGVIAALQGEQHEAQVAIASVAAAKAAEEAGMEDAIASVAAAAVAEQAAVDEAKQGEKARAEQSLRQGTGVDSVEYVRAQLKLLHSSLNHWPQQQLDNLSEKICSYQKSIAAARKFASSGKVTGTRIEGEDTKVFGSIRKIQHSFTNDSYKRAALNEFADKLQVTLNEIISRPQDWKSNHTFPYEKYKHIRKKIRKDVTKMAKVIKRAIKAPDDANKRVEFSRLAASVPLAALRAAAQAADHTTFIKICERWRHTDYLNQIARTAPHARHTFCSPPALTLPQLLNSDLFTHVCGINVNGSRNLKQMAKQRKYIVNYLLLQEGFSPNRDDDSLLFHAAKNGYTDIVKLLIQHGVKLDIKYQDDIQDKWVGGRHAIPSIYKNKTALCAAASNGHEDIVRLLIEAQADLDISDSQGHTPLQAAIRSNKPQIERLLRDAGAQEAAALQAARPPGGQQDSGGGALGTGMHVDPEMLWSTTPHVEHQQAPGGGALGTGMHVDPEMLWSTTPHVEHQQAPGGGALGRHRTPEMLWSPTPPGGQQDPAARAKLARQQEARDQLIQAAELSSQLNSTRHIAGGERPLYSGIKQQFIRAVEVGNLNGVVRWHQSCLDCGMKPADFYSQWPRSGADLLGEVCGNPTHSKLMSQNVEIRGQEDSQRAAIVQYLVREGHDINAKDIEGRSALWWAASRGYEQTVGVLLASNARFDVKNNYGSTPLDKAATRGHLNIARQIIEAGANVNTRNGKDETPLYAAASNGHEDIVRLLIEEQANLDISDSRGYTPLQAAIRSNKPQIARLLRDAGAKLDGTREALYNALVVYGGEKVAGIAEALSAPVGLDRRNKKAGNPPSSGRRPGPLGRGR